MTTGDQWGQAPSHSLWKCRLWLAPRVVLPGVMQVLLVAAVSGVEPQNRRHLWRLRKKPWPDLLRQVSPARVDVQLTAPPSHV